MSMTATATIPAPASGGHTNQLANPTPLGLAAFAMPVFVLAAGSAGWIHGGTDAAFLGLLLANGGLVQLLAGMLEFRHNNVFGATSASCYGGFFLGLGVWAVLVAPHYPPEQARMDVGWMLVAVVIFNTYIMLLATATNLAVFAVFLGAEITLGLGAIGALTDNSMISHLNGYAGILLALVGWYTSAAVLVAEMTGREVLPLGKPFGPLVAG